MDAALALAIPLIMVWEGFRSAPYQDVGGVWTIGFGTLCQPSTPAVTRELAEQWLRLGVARRYASGLKLSPTLATESPSRQAAMMSWLYNLGPTNYAHSTLRRRVNEGNWIDAAQENGRWVFDRGRRISGLVSRRAAESVLMLRG